MATYITYIVLAASIILAPESATALPSTRHTRANALANSAHHARQNAPVARAVPTTLPTGWTYQGCFTDSSSSRLMGSTYALTTSVEACLNYCHAKGISYAGLEDGKQCFCATTVPTTKTTSTACYMTCSGGNQCGGYWAMDIYHYGTTTTTSTTAKTSTTATKVTSSPVVVAQASTTKTTTTTTAKTTTSAAATTSSGTGSLGAVSWTQESVPITSKPPTSANTKWVYAHHIIGNTYSYTQSTWASDIALAAAAGINGFALNVGSDSWEPAQVASAYAAAKAYGTTFKLFLSLDMTSLPCASDADAATLRNYVTTYKSHPNQAMYMSKQLVGTFGGEYCQFGESSVNAGWTTHFKTPLTSAGYPTYFVPAIFTDPSTFAADTWFDGELNWNSGWPTGATDLTLASDDEYMTDLGTKGYMAAVSPDFFTYYGPNSYNKDWIYRSDNWLIATRFEDLISIRDDLDLIEIITWNDYGESSYIGPIRTDQPNSQGWVDGFPHQAYLTMLVPFYVKAFTTGSWPAITTDYILLWSRPHPKAAVASAPTNPKPDYWQDTDDNTYAWVLTKSAASLTIRSGANSHTWTLGAGATRVSITSGAGPIVASVVRSGSITAHVDTTGSFSYNLNPVDYNFNYYVQGSS